jgi:CubicO group peptidase (beta-lactamase class C family)
MAQIDGKIRAVEIDLRAGRSLDRRMIDYHVPGSSIAVVENGTIESAKAYGIADANAGTPVNVETLFQAASISKAVTVAAVLRLVEAGRLGLDDPINEHLRRWRIPEGKHINRRRVTVRDLACHNAGLTVKHFDGYAPGQPLPTILEILEGKPPATNPPVRHEAPPGTHRYSSGGFTVLELLLTELTGQSFPALMAELVLEPVGMRRSTFVQPLPADLAGNAAAAHDEQGAPVPGRWRVYPAAAAGGLWATPVDLARFAMAIQASYSGERGSLLRQETAQEMLRVQAGPRHGAPPDQRGPDFGLGFAIDAAGLRFSHGGINYGYYAHLVASVEGGQGAVVMTNSEGGEGLIREILGSIAAVYRWVNFHFH